MPRPEKKRKICINPASYYFKPAGVPLKFLKEVQLSWDELEAIRLADLIGLYQDEAALRMKVSRTTFGRILKSGRIKIADCLINGKAINIPETIPDNIIGNFHKCKQCGQRRIKSECPKCIKNQGEINENSSSQ
jgi:uncharacterized protein